MNGSGLVFGLEFSKLERGISASSLTARPAVIKDAVSLVLTADGRVADGSCFSNPRDSPGTSFGRPVYRTPVQNGERIYVDTDVPSVGNNILYDVSQAAQLERNLRGARPIEALLADLGIPSPLQGEQVQAYYLGSLLVALGPKQ